MPNPLQELGARLEELQASVRFVSAAAALRPRLGDVMNWTANANVVALGQAFMEVKTSRVEALYGALLVRSMAAFERFVRHLVDYAVEQTASKAKSYDDLSQRIRFRNTALTGRVLATIEAPREHLSLDYELLASNLASCKSGSDSFRLNASAFSASITGGSPSILERALDDVNVSEWWDAVGRSTALQRTLETRKTRETGQRAKERLIELWRWRNHIAHGGDEDISLDEAAITNAITFITQFAIALELEVRSRLK